jgi:uncharacterized membrane protein
VGKWSIDILRQSGWDLWLIVCGLASLALVLYAVFGRLWRKLSGWLALLMVAAGMGGTIAVLVIPSLHNPFVGMGWTFILLCLLSATFYLNLLPQLGERRTTVLLGMRVLALAMLVPMLFDPVLRFVTKPAPDRPLVFLIDMSGSMSFPDVQNGPTRIQSVWQTLRPQLSKINDNFIPRYFAFSTGLEELKKPDEIAKKPADGKATDIGKAITKAFSLTLPTDGAVVLISDGIDNVSPGVADLARGGSKPIHTVRVGSEQAEPAALANVAVDNVETTDDFVVQHESKVKVTIKSSALANHVVDVKLSEVDSDGKIQGKLTTTTLVLQPLPDGQLVELPFKPHTVGIQRLAVWIDPIAGERSIVDNRQEFQGLALDPRIKVLFIEGRARPEYKPLKLALDRDSNVEVATLLRITADRFTAGGTVDGEPFMAMPTSKEGWTKFDVVILGDLDSSFLTKAQQLEIEQFCSAGGGLMMIGGQNNFGPGGYKDTLIEKALPVFVGDTNSPQEKTPFIPTLTQEGQANPAMEGLAEWFLGPDGKPASKLLKPLNGNIVVGKPKAGASVLLTHADRPGPDGKPQIVLAVERYGEGRSAAFTADTTYRWSLEMAGMGQGGPYKTFWGQLVRWLAGADTRNRSRGPGIDGLLNKSMFQLGENVRVRAMVRDEKGDATRYAQVFLRVKQVGSKDTQQIPLNPVDTRNGLYDVTIPHPDKGDWTAELIAIKDKKDLGKQELKFTVIPPAEEMLKLAANPKLLRDIASETNGFHYELAQLPNLIDELIRQKPLATSREESIHLANAARALLAWMGHRPDWDEHYDLPMQGFLVMSLLTAEWILRRRWQLP